MTILAVVRDVCAKVGVTLPQSVFSGLAGNRTMQEMVSLANEIAQRIAYDTRDWTKLRRTITYTGDGVWVPAPPDPPLEFVGTTAFPLPGNFKRMLLTTNVWRSTSTLTPMTFVPDLDEWIQHRIRGEVDTFGEWTLMDDKIHIWPMMSAATATAAAITASFSYLDKNCVSLATGGAGDSFLQDGDSFMLDERLLRLGMIWQWKSDKGSPYAEDMSTYGDALTTAMGHDIPSPILISGRVKSASRIAYPWPL